MLFEPASRHTDEGIGSGGCKRSAAGSIASGVPLSSCICLVSCMCGRLPAVCAADGSSTPSTTLLPASALQVSCNLLLQHQAVVTASTITHLLLALSTSCPQAATEPLMSLVWAKACKLCTRTGSAAAVVWAGSQLSQQPARQQALHLFCAAADAAEAASLQQLVVLLQQLRVGGWPIEVERLQTLLHLLLNKQAAALASFVHAQEAAGIPRSNSGRRQLQQKQHSHGVSKPFVAGCCTESETLLQCSATTADSSSHEITAGCDKRSSSRGTPIQCSSSSADSPASGCRSHSSHTSSSHQAARLFGLANHRLKSVAAATAAAAAWSEVMTPPLRALALQNAQQLMQLHACQQPQQQMSSVLMLNVMCLANDCSSGGVDAQQRREVLSLLEGHVHVQQVQMPAGLYAVFQKQCQQQQ